MLLMAHRINYIEIFIVPLVLIIVSCYLDMASGDSACFLAHGKVIVISLCIRKPIELIKSAVIVNQSLCGTLETQVSIALFRVWRHNNAVVSLLMDSIESVVLKHGILMESNCNSIAVVIVRLCSLILL